MIFLVDEKTKPVTKHSGTINLDLLIKYKEILKNGQKLREVTFDAYFIPDSNNVKKIETVLENKNSELSQLISSSVLNRGNNTQSVSNNSNQSPTPSLSKNYTTFPSMDELKNMTKEELKAVNTLTVKNSNGEVYYDCLMDLTYVNLDAIEIEKRMFSVSRAYGDETYNKLNKKAFVLLNNMGLDKENCEEDFMRNSGIVNKICLDSKVN